ncbi:MAG: hypothetical protein IJV89_10590 [Lentisphaeria bacterium]|nr:hypothetical protein [Lentisphaeria bacterium]
MKNSGKKRIILIAAALLILFACIGMTAFLLFSNYQNVALFKQAQSHFLRGDDKSLDIAEAQLLQIIRNDDDHEAAYKMLSAIAGKRRIYPEQVYYSYMAHKLNPLSAANKTEYIKSLLFAREFERLENFLSHQAELSDKSKQILLYAAGRNNNFKKYPAQFDRRSNDNKIGELALLLFKYNRLTIQEKLTALSLHFQNDDAFLQQEILAAQAELYLQAGKIDLAEKSLLAAYHLNEFAFAPALGRFYANFRTFGQALKIFEKYLKTYHDQAIAIQTAEIYCLLKKTEKIAGLQKAYQADSGTGGMLCSYYFDALTALAKDDMASLKELVMPLRKNINTPLAAFMFFCADVSANDPAAVLNSYTALLAHRNYLDLQSRADRMVSDLLKRSLAAPANDLEQLLALAQTLYKRKPEAFAAKFILLVQKKSRSLDVALLKDAQKRFGNDPGIIKIAVEYYLNKDLSEAGKLITAYKKAFPGKKTDMLRYEIVLALKNKDHEQASALFMKHFSPEIIPEYWHFASAALREKDLLFLSKDPVYAPFCQAQLCLKKGDKEAACRLLANADAHENTDLLFFAAKTLAENGKNQAALKKYALFPEKSPYQVVVLLNMAELFAEESNLEQALILANRAYTLAPQMPEAQLCYADKLHKKGESSLIPDIVKLSGAGALRTKMKPLWVAGMIQRIKMCNISTQREKIREQCRQLLVVAPKNKIALEYLKKLDKMPQ